MTSAHAHLRLVDAPAPSDAELCRAFLAGDRDGFGRLVLRYQETVFKLVRRYAPAPDDAKELTQRAFLQALEAARRTLPRLRAADGELPFKAWLLRIAINVGKNHVRDAARWPTAPVTALDVVSSGGVDAQAALELGEQKAATRRAVLELPRRQREVFTLRVDAGLPFAEIAKTLGISEGNAKSHFHHAVKRLKQTLGVEAAEGGRHDL